MKKYILLVLSLILVACATPATPISTLVPTQTATVVPTQTATTTATVTPIPATATFTPAPILGIEVPVSAYGLDMTITNAVVADQYTAIWGGMLGTLKSDPGFTYVIVFAKYVGKIDSKPNWWKEGDLNKITSIENAAGHKTILAAVLFDPKQENTVLLFFKVDKTLDNSGSVLTLEGKTKIDLTSFLNK